MQIRIQEPIKCGSNSDPDSDPKHRKATTALKKKTGTFVPIGYCGKVCQQNWNLLPDEVQLFVLILRTQQNEGNALEHHRIQLYNNFLYAVC
jgi:hypothetical protein